MHIDFIELPCTSPFKDLAVACARLQGEAFPHQAWDPSFFETFLSASYGRGVLAFFGETLVGFLLVQQVLGEGEILSFAVAKGLQGHRIGQRLLDQTLEQARKNNLKCLFLEVKSGNDVAIHLYQKYGFLQVGIRPGYYQLAQGNQQDAHLYKLDFLT